MKSGTNASTRFLVSVVESSPDAIVGVDLDDRIVIWNAAAERMIGYSSEHAIGKQLMRLVPDEEGDAARRMLARARRGETIDRPDVHRLRRDGSTIIVDLTLAPVRDENGYICGSVGIMRDITERHEVLELLRRNERLASIGTMAAGIAHEINNPVGGILMAAQYAKSALDREDFRAVVAQALDHIEVDAKRCGATLRGLLQFARGEPTKAECDVNDIIGTSLDRCQENGVGERPRIRFERDPSLPLLPANRAEIEEALVNLIDNAMESCRETVAVEAAVVSDPPRLRITISDDGDGISGALIDHVFDPFFTTRRDEGAAGLGLSLAYAIVDGHGGTVGMASRAGAGTTTTVELPLAVSEARQAE